MKQTKKKRHKNAYIPCARLPLAVVLAVLTWRGLALRSLQVFFLQSEDQPGDPADHSRLTENVARAFCTALCPHLKLLKEDGMAKLGLRVTLDSDQVGAQSYTVRSGH